MLVIKYGEFNEIPSSLQEDQHKEFLSDDMSGTKFWAQTRQNHCLVFQSHFYSFTLCANVANFPLSLSLFFFFFGSYSFFKFYGRIVDFLRCVGFWCITKYQLFPYVALYTPQWCLVSTLLSTVLFENSFFKLFTTQLLTHSSKLSSFRKAFFLPLISSSPPPRLV